MCHICHRSVSVHVGHINMGKAYTSMYIYASSVLSFTHFIGPPLTCFPRFLRLVATLVERKTQACGEFLNHSI